MIVFSVILVGNWIDLIYPWNGRSICHLSRRSIDILGKSQISITILIIHILVSFFVSVLFVKHSKRPVFFLLNHWTLPIASKLFDLFLRSISLRRDSPVLNLSTDIVTHWREKIRQDASQFLTMCKEIQIQPSIHSLLEWNQYLAAAIAKVRFDTIFYITILPQTYPCLIAHDDHETVSAEVGQTLKINRRGKIRCILVVRSRYHSQWLSRYFHQSSSTTNLRIMSIGEFSKIIRFDQLSVSMSKQ